MEDSTKNSWGNRYDIRSATQPPQATGPGETVGERAQSGASMLLQDIRQTRATLAGIQAQLSEIADRVERNQRGADQKTEDLKAVAERWPEVVDNTIHNAVVNASSKVFHMSTRMADDIKHAGAECVAAIQATEAEARAAREEYGMRPSTLWLLAMNLAQCGMLIYIMNKLPQ